MYDVYLDANVLIEFLASDGAYRQQISDLLGAVKSKRIQVFGSAELFEEVFSDFRLKSGEHHQRIGAMWRFVSANVFHPWQELLKRERTKRKALPRSDMLVHHSVVRQLRADSADHTWCREIGPETQTLKADFAIMFNTAKADIRARIAERVTDSSTAKHYLRSETEVTRDRVQRWYARHTAESTFFDSVESPDDLPPVGELPVTRAFWSILLALVRTTQLTSRCWKPSDYYDILHYCYAAAAGRLVTDDRDLQNSIDQIKWQAAPYWTGGEFREIILGSR